MSTQKVIDISHGDPVDRFTQDSPQMNHSDLVSRDYFLSLENPGEPGNSHGACHFPMNSIGCPFADEQISGSSRVGARSGEKRVA